VEIGPDLDSVDWPLAQAFVAAQVIAQATDDLGFWVRTARERGASWGDIGAQLGTTRQAASQRFGSHP
jgi:hypothetical protein